MRIAKKGSGDLRNHRIKDIRNILSNIARWKKENVQLQRIFGDGYAIQDTFYRLLENEN